MTDDEICDYITSQADHQDDEDDSEEQDNACPIINSHAAHMLEKCLIWLEHQPEANEYNVCTLRQLCTLATQERVQSLKQRTLMDMLPRATCTSDCGDIQTYQQCACIMLCIVYCEHSIHTM